MVKFDDESKTQTLTRDYPTQNANGWYDSVLAHLLHLKYFSLLWKYAGERRNSPNFTKVEEKKFMEFCAKTLENIYLYCHLVLLINGFRIILLFCFFFFFGYGKYSWSFFIAKHSASVHILRKLRERELYLFYHYHCIFVKRCKQKPEWGWW